LCANGFRQMQQEHRAQGALLQPDAIPIWVLACMVDGLGAQWIGDDVAGRCADIFIVPQCVIVEAPSPDLRGLLRLPDALAGNSLETIHHQRKVISFAKFDQSMPVIRHQHPAEQTCITPCLGFDHQSTCCLGEIHIEKPWSAIHRDCRQQIDCPGRDLRPLRSAWWPGGFAIRKSSQPQGNDPSRSRPDSM
jgi:hypothetical protein